MTLLDRTVHRPEPVSVRAVPSRTVLALTRAEARRLLLHPLIVVAVTGWVALLVWSAATTSGEGHYPVLHEVDRETQYGPLLIGLAGIVAANSAVLRARRHGTEAHFGVLVVPPWRRTVAHALSVLPLALVVAVVVAGQFTWDAMQSGAVGHASFFELATGPLVVLLFGVVGVLLSRLVRSVFAGPLAVIVLLAVMLVPSGSSPLRWLAPIALDEGVRALPSDLVGRPASWHALYLVGLTVLAGVGAMLASGGRTRAVSATAAGALAVTLIGAVAQVAEPSDALVSARERATRDPGTVQECVRREATTYCAFPEFTPWIDEWHAVTEGVRALAGAPAAERELTVRQRVYALDGPGGSRESPASPRGEVTVSTAWGGERELEFAASLARGLVVDDESSPGVYCDARGILIVWLAIEATPDGEAAFATTQSNTWGGGATILAPVSAVTLRDREYAVVRALLQQPVAETARRVAASFDELSSAGTSTDRAAELLGVTAPPETSADREWLCA